ncbi:Eco57I restriction-modification methylase domain-containing protein [Bradyrhizobium sp. HKCCYLRH3059]|uniref:Eco57I restriction-modification methylase domain-containing protein n=1 Tax=Bradyrhizobium sp. HKCCYLRH3059 TaxID=3420745 RepID=UPI003EC07EF6
MVAALGHDKADKWLEPCIGHGALLAALSQIGVGRDQIIGLDVDPCERANDRLASVRRGKEFLRWSNRTRLRFDKIVANPPYIALERLDPTIRDEAVNVSLSNEIRVTSNGNAWYAFLCAAIRLLKKDGSLCFLLPAAWDYANYAASLRNSIWRYFTAVDIFRTATPVFRAENVQEGSIVLVARGRRNENGGGLQRVLRHEIHAIDDLVEALSSNRSRSARGPKLLAAPAIMHRRVKRELLGSLISVRLGTVTGDSSYFLLNESRRSELRIPVCAVRPVLSKARHLSSAKITASQWEALKDADERVWLFYPGAKSLRNRSVLSYLEYGLSGGCKVDNHKVSSRQPWFRCLGVAACDAFVSGMSKTMPTLSICAMPQLAATNTLYTVSFRDPNLSEQGRLGIAMSLLQSDVRKQLRSYGRTYADGLLKHEPCDLLRLEVPAVGEVRANWSKYRLALEALKNGDEHTSSRIADDCLF